MRHRISSRSLRTQIVIIVLVSMSVMLVFQGLSMGNFISRNNQYRREYIGAANETIAASLNAMGENIRSMAVYIASFESFKNLYFPNRSSPQNTADMVSDVFYSVRFIANYYPIILDVAVVGLNKVPFSYYLGFGYGFIDLMQTEYDFTDPDATESRFFYFDGEDYFIYVTPISALFSSTGDAPKIASCIFICDMSYIRDLVMINTADATVNFSVYDQAGRLIASSGHEENRINKTMEVVSAAGNMGLSVTASGGSAGIAPGRGETTRFIQTFFIFSIILLVIITSAVIVLLRLRIARPISNLVKSLEPQADRPLRSRLAPSNIDEIDHIVDAVNTLLDEIEEYTQKSMAAQQKIYEMELRKNEAEIYALQSQINPHFLNNTLQCIRSIAISKGVDEIAAITLAMSELFRYSMNYEEYVFVKDELEIVRHYIVITNIRFQNRFKFSFDIDPEIESCRMCRMILQPLVENAVRHGVSQREDGGLVVIIGRMKEGVISFEVTDDGPGFDAERLMEIRQELFYSFTENREMKKGGSFGLSNINQRLKLNYGESYGLEIEHRNYKTLVRIHFPDR
ncbi:hypothetical protein FACS189485_17400 [Spirochaetia bacterium]|nr:hypothetical protein FACS189485_17400 [Spirochaetia bacterium]